MPTEIRKMTDEDFKDMMEDPHKFGVLTVEELESEVRHIAIDFMMHRARPQFLDHFFEALICADGENFALLRPIAQVLIKKYELRCTCQEHAI